MKTRFRVRFRDDSRKGKAGWGLQYTNFIFFTDLGDRVFDKEEEAKDVCSYLRLGIVSMDLYYNYNKDHKPSPSPFATPPKKIVGRKYERIQ